MFSRLRSRFLILAACILVLPLGAQEAKRAKYVFLLIGDGMGINQRYLAEQMLRYTSGDPKRQLMMNQLPVQGLTTTYSANSAITDSAAAGTALACGVKTNNGKIGVLPDGAAAVSIAEQAKQAGMRVGIITSVSIDHATPAVFYAHEGGRNSYYEIAASLPKSGFDFFGGGKALGDQPNYRQDRPSVVDLAKEKGYRVIDSLADLQTVTPGTPVWAYSPVVDGAAAIPYEIDQTEGIIPLADFAAQGIRLLDNPNGFFVMIEGGRIDWACHVNDPMTAAVETQAFDHVVEIACDFQRQHPDDTLIVVTADHETGGMSFGSTFTGYTFHPEPLAAQTVSYEKLVGYANRYRKDNTPYFDVSAELRQLLGLEVLNHWENDLLKNALEMTKVAPADRHYDWAQLERYGKNEPLAVASLKIVSSRAGLGWGTFAHTGMPVQTSAIGVGAERFADLYDNTELCNRIRELMGLPKP